MLNSITQFLGFKQTSEKNGTRMKKFPEKETRQFSKTSFGAKSSKYEQFQKSQRSTQLANGQQTKESQRGQSQRREQRYESTISIRPFKKQPKNHTEAKSAFGRRQGAARHAAACREIFEIHIDQPFHHKKRRLIVPHGFNEAEAVQRVQPASRLTTRSCPSKRGGSRISASEIMLEKPQQGGRSNGFERANGPSETDREGRQRTAKNDQPHRSGATGRPPLMSGIL